MGLNAGGGLIHQKGSGYLALPLAPRLPPSRSPCERARSVTPRHAATAGRVCVPSRASPFRMSLLPPPRPAPPRRGPSNWTIKLHVARLVKSNARPRARAHARGLLAEGGEARRRIAVRRAHRRDFPYQ